MFETLIPAEWSASVAAMEPLRFWIFTLATMTGAAAGFYASFRFLSRARLIEDTPTSKVRSAVQGYVELEGTGELMPGEPILAPLTGTPCLWFSYKVEERHSESSTGSGGRWRVLHRERSSHLFYLVDETGKCLIDPDGADVIPSVREEWYGDSETWPRGPAPKHDRTAFITRRYRYTEQRIQPNDSLHVIGWFTTDDDAVAHFDAEAELRTLLREWKHDQGSLIARFDRDGNGVLDVTEWDGVIAAAREQISREQATHRSHPLHHVMSKPRDGRAYILSTLPQHHLAGRYRRYSFAALLLFLLCGAITTWLLSIRFTLL